METIRIEKIIEKDGEVKITGLPLKKGQKIEMILLIKGEKTSNETLSTAKELLDSGLVGLWEKRRDIQNTEDFAEKLREKAQYRHR